MKQAVERLAEEASIVPRSALDLERDATTFDRLVGPSDIEVDGFFSLNVQPTDLDLSAPDRALVRISERLRRGSRHVPALRYVADSLDVRAVVRDRPTNGTPGSGSNAPGMSCSRRDAV